MSKPNGMKYYKLSESSSVFYDSKSKMKVTKGVPSRTLLVTPRILDGVKSGHLIEIQKGEYDQLINDLPTGTKAAIQKEQNLHAPFPKVEAKAKPVVEEEEAEEEEAPADDQDEAEAEEEEQAEPTDDPKERKKLLKELESVTSKKQYKELSKKSNAEIKAFLAE